MLHRARLALSSLVFAGASCRSPAPPRVEPVDEEPPVEPAASVSSAWGDALASDVAGRPLRAELEQDAGALYTELELGAANVDTATLDRAAWALGRIATRPALVRLRALLEEGEHRLSAAGLTSAAFVGDAWILDAVPEERDLLERTLRTLYAVTRDEAQGEALLLGLARVASAATVDAFEAELTVDAEPRRRRALLEAIGIACSRGSSLSDAAFDRVATSLRSEHAQVRTASAFALTRCATSSAEALAGERRFRLVAAVAPVAAANGADEAYWGWRAIGSLGELPEALPDGVLAGPEPSARVENAAVAALTQHEQGRRLLIERLLAAPLETFSRTRLQAVAMAFRGMRTAAARGDEGFERLASLGPRLDALEPSPETQVLRCELALVQSLRARDRGLFSRCAEQASVDASMLERLGIEGQLELARHQPKAVDIDWLVERAGDRASARTAALALSALAEVDAPKIPAVLRQALSRDDVGVRTAAAAAIAARAVDRTRRDVAAIESLLMALDDLDEPQAVEGKVAVLEALAALTRSELRVTKPPPWLATDILPLQKDPRAVVRRAAWQVLEGHPELREQFVAGVPERFPGGFSGAEVALSKPTAEVAGGLRLHTASRAIDISFAEADAPIAQANLAALAFEGFFDGLTFHRVVPGFVVQGGDPRGDGYGGAGHLLPDELGNGRFERGTVGLALAGPDTASSQFFITLSRQPHLDGRYPIVGHVVAGDEHLDAVWAGDEIERVEVLPESR